MFSSIGGTFVKSNRPGPSPVHVATGEQFASRTTRYLVHTLCGRDVGDSKATDRRGYPRYGPERVDGPATCQRCRKLHAERG